MGVFTYSDLFDGDANWSSLPIQTGAKSLVTGEGTGSAHCTVIFPKTSFPPHSQREISYQPRVEKNM